MVPATKLSTLCLILVMTLTACPNPADDDDTPSDCNLLTNLAPEVIIDEPDNAELFGTNDPINWLVRVTDEDSLPEDITLEALDLSDGTPQSINFDVPAPGNDGRSEFTLSGDTLGDGVVVVRIVASDELGCQGDDQVVLCIDVPASECDFEIR